ncbi:MAG: RnfABCDGE type electron transport complex subunit B [Gammaproteobacteria bacterium]|nr:RnfABCDGE type electron transport complex subunit B [Rhodocyclaceae bacterium]MCP5202390.1 RnfABCDGE type electron transport complex subunit B [Gammaproteobacteria bacterium]
MGSGTAEVLVEALDALLPQQQCRRCRQADCRTYAEALAAGQAAVDDCPPGGEATRHALAARLGMTLDPARPVHGAAEVLLARVDQLDCIGCTRCIEACPVDAIVGASLARHAVLAAHCTGCGLCLPVCPTDCITLLPRTAADEAPPPRVARQRYLARRARLAQSAAGAANAALVDLADLTPVRLRDEVLEAVRRRRENDRSGPGP